jgi:hypothetical protein
MRTSLPDFAVGVGGFDGQYKTHGEEIGAGFEFITHHHTKGTSLNEGEDFLLHCGVRLCQTSWRDPAVRSHVGILGGAVWLTVFALLALQLLAVCHSGGQGPGPEYLGISNDE